MERSICESINSHTINNCQTIFTSKQIEPGNVEVLKVNIKQIEYI